ncbi:hypothetical protein BYT27DRAFT_7194777 [Phlegmacium glaucopus]|nr:hypothetical protein BYT27DRAFT_7194777 [Phlegmacium glaucopus]
MHHKSLTILFASLCFVAYPVFGAPVDSSAQGLVSFEKRDYASVQDAVNDIHPGNKIGAGHTSRVYSLPQKFNGHDAVAKVIDLNERPTARHPGTEAANLYHANQFLGWGHDAATNTHYLIQKNKGMHASETGLGQAQLDHLAHGAIEKNIRKHGMENRDKNGDNFAYKKGKDGQWKGNVVDWARAEHHTPHADPGLHPHPVTGPHLPYTPPPSSHHSPEQPVPAGPAAHSSAHSSGCHCHGVGCKCTIQ